MITPPTIPQEKLQMFSEGFLFHSAKDPDQRTKDENDWLKHAEVRIRQLQEEVAK